MPDIISFEMNDNKKFKMSSLDFLNEVINPAREAAGEAAHKNSKFLRKIEDEIDDLGVGTKIPHPYNPNQTMTVYELTFEQMTLVGMRESKAVRRAVLAKLKTMHHQASTPQLPKDYLSALKALVVSEENRMTVIAENSQLAKAVKEMEPKVDAYDDISQAVNAQTLDVAAKILKTGPNRLTRWLRDNGYFKHTTVPYQKYVDRKLFRLVEKSYRHNKTGEKVVYHQTLVTGKGILHISKQMNGGAPLFLPLGDDTEAA
ncbi:phage antirepressor KilAC domain-containing protein [Pseudovibrio sp. SPO723]|uniref:phage antirepressor KilAC domain-containing protein n=1 Tax=Nesiotobacter zosterae TaxID=392721 RepID=UPI0029C32D32|nr:phage antirepressor KilAC domain-containing protein [Pseudovibrio sp. SPO723]MDX5592602.1 phage antirepressor KilAC domain-containing protein [Pseudovibrio sp. SPO723]